MFNLLDHSYPIEIWGNSFLQCLLYCFFIDITISRHFTKARWFVLHSIINIIITHYSFNDLYYLIFDPVNCLTDLSINSTIPWMMNITIHLYHTLIYFNSMTWLDWLHHGTMTFILTPICFMFSSGKVMNASHVFIMGIPGAIDYALLAMVKYGCIKPITEKKINTILNVWIRSPGIIICSYLSFAQIHTENSGNVYARLMASLLYFWNAQYFMERVVGNYYQKKII